MNCSRCGASNQVGAFCSNCGAPISNYQVPQNNNLNDNVGSITFIRGKRVVGCAMPIDIFIDGYLMGSIPNNSTKQFYVYYGTHTLSAKSGFNQTNLTFTVNENQKNLVFDANLKMGLMSPNIEIIFKQYYN